jgi:acetamidase/formamidase
MRYALAAASLIAALLPATASAQQTHQFTPDTFYNTYSFAHPPALHIKPGDRVATKTIDAAGVDWNGRTVSQGPNPQTGPFFVDGAEPGDMLVVTFNAIETNRASAWSGSVLSPYATTPQAIAGRTDRESKRVSWTIDKAKGVARLDDASTQPGGIELPLRPMLGCVGVAPRGKEAIATSTPGAFGGNMDYAHLNAGAIVMLPVNEPGALLFVGDGHARQGEGEVAGTGLETSMDVEFTVQLVKKKAIGWPRMETPTHLLVLGSARPLLEAFQIATAELQRWLQADYGFTERGAQTFMGQATEYEVANVVDPAFTVVAKIPKALLPKR